MSILLKYETQTTGLELKENFLKVAANLPIFKAVSCFRLYGLDSFDFIETIFTNLWEFTPVFDVMDLNNLLIWIELCHQNKNLPIFVDYIVGLEQLNLIWENLSPYGKNVIGSTFVVLTPHLKFYNQFEWDTVAIKQAAQYHLDNC
jgi:hypothetical protein